MYGNETAAIEVSSTSMNVGRITASAIIHGLTARSEEIKHPPANKLNAGDEGKMFREGGQLRSIEGCSTGFLEQRKKPSDAADGLSVFVLRVSRHEPLARVRPPRLPSSQRRSAYRKTTSKQTRMKSAGRRQLAPPSAWPVYAPG